MGLWPFHPGDGNNSSVLKLLVKPSMAMNLHSLSTESPPTPLIEGLQKALSIRMASPHTLLLLKGLIYHKGGVRMGA